MKLMDKSYTIFVRYVSEVLHTTIRTVMKRRLIDMNKEKNPNISCTVCACEHHDDKENYCTLNSIKVGTHEKNPTQIECTDCESFALK